LPDGIAGTAAGQQAPASGAAVGFDVEVTRPGPDEVAQWLEEHGAGTGRAGLAMRGSWGRGTGTLTALAIATADGAGAYLDPAALTEEDEAALAAWLADPERPKALHDAKGPMHALAARGLELAGVTSDTALAAYLALPGQRSFDLADLTLRYLGKELSGGGEETTGQLALDLAGEQNDEEAAIASATALGWQAPATAQPAPPPHAHPGPPRAARPGCCMRWSCRW